MKPCPRCRQWPDWKYAHHTSRKSGVPTSSLVCWCAHCQPFMKRAAFIPHKEQAAIGEQWDAFAEELFAAYTRTWTDEQRADFRERWLHPTPQHLPGQMTLEQIAETKKLVESMKTEKGTNSEDRDYF